MPAFRAVVALTLTMAVAAACQHGPVLPDASDRASGLRASEHSAQSSDHATEQASPYLGTSTRAESDGPAHGSGTLTSDGESPYLGTGHRSEDEAGGVIGSGT
jgi:hypothetical protein